MMIQFTCPGCKAAHSANRAFADRKAKCVRCGATLYIPPQSGVASFAPYGALDRDGRNTSGPPSAGAESGRGRAADGTELAPAADDRRRSRKRSPWPLLLTLLLLLLVAGGVYYFLFLRKPPPPTKKELPPPAADQPEPPPPPYEFVGPILPPPPPPEPIRINAERLNEEFARDPQGTNARYAGRLMEIQGECEKFQSARLTFRVNSSESGITAVLPAYLPKFRDEDGRPIAPPAAPALLGGWFTLVELPPDEKPIAGRPAAVRGVYRMDGELVRADLVRLTAPADAVYLGKTLTVLGRVSGAEDDDSGGKRVTLLKWSSTGLVEVGGRLTKSASAALRVKLGDVIAISGKCSGRTQYRVWLENSTVVPAGGNQLSALKLAADYEQDLLRFPPIPPTTRPVKVTAAEFATAYRDDAAAANRRYEHQVLELTGTVLKTDPKARSIQLETPTDTPIQLRLVFEPDEFAQVPPDDPVITVRVEFRGGARGQRVFVLPDCRYHDPDITDPKVRKLTADFLPLKAGRQWEVVRVAYREPPVKPVKPKPGEKPADPPDDPPAGKLKPHPAQRIHYQVLADGRVAGTQIQAGNFAGESLFGVDAPPVRWFDKAVKPTSPSARLAEVVALRATDRLIEQAVATADPKNPDGAWVPLLRLNSKAGRVWEAELAPGVVQTTTVDSFFTDAKGREAVKVVSVLTTGQPAGARQETVVVYARGVGEVSRVVTRHDPKAGAKVLVEQMLVGEPTEPKEEKVLDGQPADKRDEPKK